MMESACAKIDVAAFLMAAIAHAAHDPAPNHGLFLKNNRSSA